MTSSSLQFANTKFMESWCTTGCCVAVCMTWLHQHCVNSHPIALITRGRAAVQVWDGVSYSIMDATYVDNFRAKLFQEQLWPVHSVRGEAKGILDQIFMVCVDLDKLPPQHAFELFQGFYDDQEFYFSYTIFLACHRKFSAKKVMGLFCCVITAPICHDEASV